MIQRIRRSRLLPSLVAALVAATMAGGVASAVTEAKADETVTMCVSALGTKIRFVHTSADCTAGELVRTWNIEGPRGSRGLRGNTGATGPTGPSGPVGATGVAGTSTASYTGGFGVDTALSVAFFVPSGTTPTPVVVATASAAVPGGTHPYVIRATSPTVTQPNNAAGCTGGTGTAPSWQLTLNTSTTLDSGAAATDIAIEELRVLSGGTNVLTLQLTPGVCGSTLLNTTGHLADVTNRRITMIYGG